MDGYDLTDMKKRALNNKTISKRLTDHKALINEVLPLVEHHLKPALLYKSNQVDGVSDAAIRRLSTKVNIKQLLLLGQADHFGRLTEDALKRDYPAGTWLRERAQKLDVEDSKPAPLISGKDLIEHGFQEGKILGDLLKQCYVMQLNGELKTKQDAIDFIKKSQLPHET